MKKKYILILVMYLISSMSILCSGCKLEKNSHIHQWIAETCTTPKVCSDCSETQGKPLGHYVKLGYCSRCNININDLKDNIYTITICGRNITNGLHNALNKVSESYKYSTVALQELYVDSAESYLLGCYNDIYDGLEESSKYIELKEVKKEFEKIKSVFDTKCLHGDKKYLSGDYRSKRTQISDIAQNSLSYIQNISNQIKIWNSYN